jgi:K+ transporter
LGQGSSAAVVCQGLVGWAANTGSVNRHATARGALAVGALGVVFGDIGTSPLYTVQTVFNPHDPHPVTVSTASIFGIVSLIFWSVTIIVTVTYVYFLSRIELHRGDTPGMSGWRKRLFLATSRITAAAEYFQLPRERTVIMGSRIEL